MPIKIFLGNLGSGKTVNAVRLMAKNSDFTYYSNIRAKLRNTHMIGSEMICSKTEIGEKRTGEKVYKYSLNTDFWLKAKKPCNVILDECHNMLNPRRAMSSVNIIVTDWIAMLRRVLGEGKGQGDLILITQLYRRIDPIARELASDVFVHTMHYRKTCEWCGAYWVENTDMPGLRQRCPACNASTLRISGHRVEVKAFGGNDAYTAFSVFGMSSWYARYFVNDVKEYFSLYDSWSWDNLLSSLY